MRAEVMELEVRNQISDHYNTFFYATMCHVCKRFGDDVHLKRCSGCRMIAYCGRQHQKEHWKQHKPLCKAIQDVLQNMHSTDDSAVTVSSVAVIMERWNKKVNFMLLVSNKLGRRLKIEELEMVYFPRECRVCYERNDQSLEDCQKCACSFCKSHIDGIEHRDICARLELCLRIYLSAIRGEIGPPDLRSYLKHVSYNGTFQNMKDFIKAFGNIHTDSEMSYNMLTARHSVYLSYPLTLFHAMRLLNYVSKSKDLVIHVLGASDTKEATLMAWEVLPRLIETVMSMAIIMIGPELKCQFNPPHICDKCKLRKKKCLVFEFHDMLYENYVRSPLFVKPDLVVGFNLGLHVHELGSEDETWAASIQVLAKQNCPFVLTCLMLLEFHKEIDRINTILGRKVNYVCFRKNPFAGFFPGRSIPNIGLECLSYTNQFLIIYRSLCS